MTSQATELNREPAIWARLLHSRNEEEVSPEVAEYLLSITFGLRDRDRMRKLADKSELGALTPDEQAELDGYLHVGNLLAIMQSKARVSLRAINPR